MCEYFEYQILILVNEFYQTKDPPKKRNSELLI